MSTAPVGENSTQTQGIPKRAQHAQNTTQEKQGPNTYLNTAPNHLLHQVLESTP